ncbi:cupin domain-containing protein [Subtercola endophyticus]|uniref:cupin domain-containing protein n=1 Tax=Subtercola endophyticus TaxID=2895559 RepID=UPI001E335FA4|nr:cupin domain-containing protein [Subtercola endophyticus]UFS58203.1 cupin domain-containing protein [Subtercola endophyticus]
MIDERGRPTGQSADLDAAGLEAAGGPGRMARRTADGRLIEWVDVPPMAARLGLEPHPEGGWYRRTWASPASVSVSDGSAAAAGPRPAATSIYFFLPSGEASAWHRVEFDEIWFWHGPDPVMFQLGGSGDAPAFSGENARMMTLGGDIARDEHPQVVIPPKVWQRTLPGDGETLVSCVVSPGFSYDAWMLAE